MVVVYQNLAMQYCCSFEKWSNKHTRRTSSICRNKNNFMGYSCWCWELSQKNVWCVFACCITYFHTANCRYEEEHRRLLQSFLLSDEEPRSTSYWFKAAYSTHILDMCCSWDTSKTTGLHPDYPIHCHIIFSHVCIVTMTKVNTCDSLTESSSLILTTMTVRGLAVATRHHKTRAGF